MAGIAFGTKAGLMNVLQAVARQAGAANILVMFVDMATFAGDLFVRPFEGKLGFGMVEGLGRAPAFVVMTGGAFFPQASLMRLNGLVAVHAFSGCIAEFYFWFVTAVAAQRLMGACQFEIGLTMIESLYV